MVKLPKKQSTVYPPAPRLQRAGSQQSTAGNNPFPGQSPPEPLVRSVQQPVVPGLGIKEREVFERQDELQLEEIRKELEVAPEVKETGVEVKSEEIELPEVVKQMGVVPSDASQPVASVATNLPLTDDKIVTGFGAPIISSLRWLVEWCIRQLKKVHIRLKKIHGQIVRVVTK